MKTYYLIREKLTAINSGDLLFGKEVFIYFGRRSRRLGWYGSAINMLGDVPKIIGTEEIIKYGYTRLSDAKKSVVYNSPFNTDLWKGITKIIQINIELKSDGISGNLITGIKQVE